MKSLIRWIRSSLSTRLTFWVVLLVTAIFAVAFTLMFAEAREVVREEAWNKATKTIESAVLHIDNTLHRTEVAANNMLVVIEQHLDNPDMMFELSRRVLENNPELSGTSISFEPYYFKDKGRYFSAYSYNNGDSIQTEQEGTDNYQYHCMDWYLIPKLLNKPYWIEPFQEDATEGIIVKDIFSSYSQPIHDTQGNVVGTFSVDICLDWFSKTISNAKPYPHSYSILLGKGGTYLVHPDTTKLFYETIFTRTMEKEDSVLSSIGEAMIAGETGHRNVVLDGEPCYVFYKPFRNTGWSVAIICPESDIFDSYHKLVTASRTIALVGLILLLIFCPIVVKRNLRPLNQLVHFSQLMTGAKFLGEVPDTKRRDEIGQLEHSFRRMQQSLRKYIDEMRQQTLTLEDHNRELTVAYERVKEDERLKTRLLRHMSEEMVKPVDGILEQAKAICNCHHEMTDEEFGQTVDKMLANTNTVTALLDQLLQKVQGTNPSSNIETE